ncbi:MAG: hypothetical protein HY360_23820 [Verrucomicrobia bacterium]|nr:hypothetical protein [Verrucomicrobiota bacterium]
MSNEQNPSTPDSRRQNKLTASCLMDLDSMVKDLRGVRGAAQSGEPVEGRPLLEVLAEEMKFLRLSGAQPSVVVPLLMNKLGLPQDGTLAMAGVLASLKAEDAAEQPDYHNRQHTLEVIVAAYILGRREKLPVYRVAELVIAAAAHDLGHTGETNQRDYERERHSIEIARPILANAGLEPPVIQRIERMILATDFRAGVPPARQAYQIARILPPMNDRRLLAVQCLLLTEADVLFSCFDLSYNEFLSRLLSAEWKRPQPNLSIAERIEFLSYVRFLSDASVQLGLETRRQQLLDELSKTPPENA